MEPQNLQILIFLVQALHIMGNPLREIPDITSLEDFSCKAAVLIDSTQEQGAIVNKSPLSLYEDKA
jgi:hypothetical protein